MVNLRVRVKGARARVADPREPVGGVSASPLHAASHRERRGSRWIRRPTSRTCTSFRSPQDPSRVVLIMNVIPSQEPSPARTTLTSTRTFCTRCTSTSTATGRPTSTTEFRFETEIRAPFDDLPVAYAGVDGVPGLPPGISALDGAGSEASAFGRATSSGEVIRKRRTELGSARRCSPCLRHRPAHHSEPRGSRQPGHLRPEQRRAHIRGAAGRDLLHRSRARPSTRSTSAATRRS